VTKFLLPLGLFTLLCAFLLVSLNRDPGFVPSPLIGKAAPQFTLPSLQDPEYTVSTQDLAGRAYLLNVWGTWCGGCRQEHPVLLDIAKQNALPLIGLNWKDDPDMARRWLAELGNPYAAVADDREGRIAIDWGVYGAPETFLVGADGTVLYRHIAPMTLDVWNTEFLPRLRAAGAP
jgi:cytochrome c biogenesis protein CcmG/thiol:disulfide interchange protein DsbE